MANAMIQQYKKRKMEGGEPLRAVPMEGGETEWDVYLAGDEHEWDVPMEGCEPSRAVLSSSHIKLVNENGHYFIMPRELAQQSFRLADVMQLSGESAIEHL